MKMRKTMLHKSAITGSLLLVFLIFPVLAAAHVIHLAPGDFQPQDPDEGEWYINSNNKSIYTQTGAVGRVLFSRSLDLPHLGTFDQVRIRYYDNSDAYLELWFIRQKVSDRSEEVLAMYTTSGSNGDFRVQDLDTFTYPTIKTKGYRYFFRIFMSAGDSDIMLSGIRVRFYAPSGE